MNAPNDQPTSDLDPLRALGVSPSLVAEALLETGHVLALVLDRQRRILHVNRYFEQISGFRRDEVRGRDPTELFAPTSEARRLDDLLSRALAGIHNHGSTVPMRRRDDSLRIIEWYDAPLAAPDDPAAALLVVGHDITDSLASARELDDYRHRLADLVERHTRDTDRGKRLLEQEVLRKNQLLSELRISEARLREREEHFRTLAQMSPTGIFRADAQGAWTYVNGRWCEICGLAYGQAMGDGWVAAVHADERDGVAQDWHRAVRQACHWEREYRVAHADGEVRWVSARAGPVQDPQSRISGYVGTVQDVTARKASEQALQRSERLFRGFFEHSNIGLAIASRDGRWLRVNSRFCAIIGRGEESLLHTPCQAVTCDQDLEKEQRLMRDLAAGRSHRFELDKRLRRADGSLVPVHATVSCERDDDGNVRFFICSFLDISARDRLQRRLEHLALRDPLTGVYNRGEMQRRLENELRRARRYQHPLSLLMMDVDHFKAVNDRHGHLAGDNVLRQVAATLNGNLRTSDYLARYGGEEFVAILPETDGSHALDLAERLRQVLCVTSLAVADTERLHLTVSVGVAQFPLHGEDPEDLLSAADQALYEAKGAGRNRVAVAAISTPEPAPPRPATG